MNDADSPKFERRWYHVTPDWLFAALLAGEGLLLLSEQFHWSAFNERKNWTVLIAMAAVCLAVLVMVLWYATSLILRWQFQFGIRSLGVLVVAIAIPCCWFAVKMRAAKRQQQAAKVLRSS